MGVEVHINLSSHYIDEIIALVEVVHLIVCANLYSCP